MSRIEKAAELFTVGLGLVTAAVGVSSIQRWANANKELARIQNEKLKLLTANCRRHRKPDWELPKDAL